MIKRENMVLTKNIILFVLVMGFSSTLLAQKPSWADYYKRQNLYPENEFLVGFVSGVNNNNKDDGKLKSVYEALAKDKLIQGIQVEIETNNSLNISNKNGKSDEEFLSKSISFSKANISGLTTKSYYDRKKKEVFAIAIVNKKELAYYYRNIIISGQEDIEQKLTEGKRYVKKGNKENALKSYYEAMPYLLKIDEARTLLIALNRKMYADISMDEINNLKIELINEIDSLQNPNNLNLSESAYFVAYGLFLQLGNIEGTISLDNFTYENTGLGSDFSSRWNQEFTSALVKTGSYEVENSENSKSFVVYGNYWKEGDLIKIVASVSRYNELIAVSKGSIPISWLKMENIDYLPEQIQLMKSLSTYKLKIVDAPSTIKLGNAIAKPIKIGVDGNDNGTIVSKEGIPIKYINTETGELVTTGLTNAAGISVAYLPAIQSSNPVLSIEASIDLATYLNIDRNSIYFVIASRQNPVLPISIDMTTEKPTIFIISEELLQNYPMDIKTLEPIVKESLSEKGYNFVDNKGDADYIINIDANTTTGSQYQGIYFAFLDINFSIKETLSGEEIYKTHLNQVKGGGGDYKRAGKKAYILGAEELKESILSSGF